MTVPAPRGELDSVVLAAARLAGVDRIWSIGGAQAVAALAWGTKIIPAVDKIVGPGNAYVAAAKRLVFGRVGIDSVAGPSEILVIADGTTRPTGWRRISVRRRSTMSTRAPPWCARCRPISMRSRRSSGQWSRASRGQRSSGHRSSAPVPSCWCAISVRRSTSRTSWPRSTWSCPWRSPRARGPDSPCRSRVPRKPFLRSAR